MDISDIIKECMAKNGYTALYSDGCGCSLNDLAPCGEMQLYCLVGYANHCPTCVKRETCPDGRRAKAEGFDFMCLGVKCHETEGDIKRDISEQIKE